MPRLEPVLILAGIALAYLALGIYALRNADPDPEQCPPDCEACKAERESSTPKEKDQ